MLFLRVKLPVFSPHEIKYIWHLAKKEIFILLNTQNNRKNNLRFLFELTFSVYSSSVKSYQYLNFNILENISYSSMTTFTFMFLVSNRLDWRDKTVSRTLELWCTYFLCFSQFLKNLKSSFSEDNVSVHALDVFV